MKFTRRAKKISVLVALGTFLITVQAFAIAPLLLYGALANAGITFGVVTSTIGAATAILRLNLLSNGTYTYDNKGRVVAKASIVPEGSSIGAQSNLVVGKDELKQEIFGDAGATKYPNIRKALIGNQSIPQDSWGLGVNNFDDSKLPQVGDIVSFSDNASGKVTSQVCITAGSTPSTIRQCSSPYSTIGTGQAHPPGFSGCTNSGSQLYVWANCDSHNYNNPNSIMSAWRYNISRVGSNIDLSKYTEQQIDAALASDPAEVNAAQRAIYQALHNGGATTDFPPTSSPAHLEDPITGARPDAASIVSAIQSVQEAQASGTAAPVPGAPDGNSTSTTVATSATVETAPDGTRTVTINKTTTVTGADGNVISVTPSTETQVYAPGVEIPQNVQDIIGGGTSTVSKPATTTTTTTTVAPNSVTVETAADGTRTVSIPRTTVVTDAEGNVISTTTTTDVLTYPPGIAIPQSIQDTIDASDAGVESSTEESESKTEDPPPDLSRPDLSTINLDPILNASRVLQGKFPFSFIGLITQIFDDLTTSPEIPDFDFQFGSFGTMTVSFQWIESTATFFRLIMGSCIIIICAWEAIKIWV